MKRCICAFSIVALLIVGASHAQAKTLAFFDFNNSSDRLAINTQVSAQTSVTMDVQSSGWFIQFVSYVQGSTLGIPTSQPPITAGDALQFNDLITGFPRWEVLVEGVSFANDDPQSLSFAWEHTALASIPNDSVHVDYSLDDGQNWTELDTFTPSEFSAYTLYDLDLTGVAALVGQSNVDFRIDAAELINIVDTFDIDNVTIAAVPEPTSLLLLGGGAMMLLSRRRRERG